MYLQEPSTPLKPTKKGSKKSRAKATEDQVAEFMAFENCDLENSSTLGSQTEQWLVVYEVESEPTIEERIEKWLTDRSVYRDSAETVKYDYYSTRKDSITKRFSDSSPTDVGGLSPFGSPQNLNEIWTTSKLAKRRLGNLSAFTFSNEDIGEQGMITKQRAISLRTANELEHELMLVENDSVDYSTTSYGNL